MALERPLWRFAHPHFFVPVKLLRSFSDRAQKNVANLLSLHENFFTPHFWSLRAILGAGNLFFR
jgi:hypothetical protein